jgi:hypothetical protein
MVGMSREARLKALLARIGQEIEEAEALSEATVSDDERKRINTSLANLNAMRSGTEAKLRGGKWEAAANWIRAAAWLLVFGAIILFAVNAHNAHIEASIQQSVSLVILLVTLALGFAVHDAGSGLVEAARHGEGRFRRWRLVGFIVALFGFWLWVVLYFSWHAFYGA